MITRCTKILANVAPTTKPLVWNQWRGVFVKGKNTIFIFSSKLLH